MFEQGGGGREEGDEVFEQGQEGVEKREVRCLSRGGGRGREEGGEVRCLSRGGGREEGGEVKRKRCLSRGRG